MDHKFPEDETDCLQMKKPSRTARRAGRPPRGDRVGGADGPASSRTSVKPFEKRTGGLSMMEVPWCWRRWRTRT